MSHRATNRFSTQWEAFHRDPNNWLPVNSSNLAHSKQEKYQRRKRAITLYLSSEQSIKSIVDQTGISRSELFRIAERAFMSRDDGYPVGFLACIPGYRVKRYELRDISSTQKSGRMQQFLRLNPEIQKQLDDWALGKKALNQSKIRGRNIKQLWLQFTKACALAGIDTDSSYPFTNSDGGREAIRRYVKALRERHFVANAKVVHGADSARLAAGNSKNLPLPTRAPYERVQLDGHRLDAIFSLQVYDESGNIQQLPLSRLWLLACIDVGSRAVLGYSLSLSENYTADDVLTCVGNSLAPWKPKELPDLVTGYISNAGLPSGVIDGCAWRVFNTLQMDNAFSHLSATVQERILDAGALEIITNKPRSPRSDSVIERFFGTLESTCLHLWPNTTGSHPKDPKRRNPEKAAEKLNLELEQLETVVDLAIANYNATPHEALNGRSPNEYLQYRLHQGSDPVRYTSEKSLHGIGLFDREYAVTVRANLAQGHKPYIKFKGARYSATWLQERQDLNKTKVILRVNALDIRTATLFLSTGECLGQLEVEPRWQEHAHSVAVRRAIAKLVRSKNLQAESHQPVLDYLDYLAKQAPLTRKARNALLKNQRQSESSTEVEKFSAKSVNKIDKRPRRQTIQLTTTLSR